MTNKNLKYFLEKKLHRSFNDFLVFEEGIDVSVQINFEKTTLEFFEKDEDIKAIDILEEILYNPEKLIDDKKNALVQLSLSGDVKAYRIIENFKDKCSDELKKWTILAFQKSRAHMEHELSNDEKIYISSGLGGSGNKLRYFFVMSSDNKVKFTDFQKNLLMKEIEFSLTKNDSIAEKITFNNYFVSIVCLVPLQISLDSILKSILAETQAFGNFLSDEIIATNTEIFSEEKIIKLINHDPDIEKELQLQGSDDADLGFFDINNSITDINFFDDDDDFNDEDFDDDDFDDDDDDDDDDDFF